MCCNYERFVVREMRSNGSEGFRGEAMNYGVSVVGDAVEHGDRNEEGFLRRLGGL